MVMYQKKSSIKVIKYQKPPYAGGSRPHMLQWIWNKGQSAQLVDLQEHRSGNF